MRKLKLGRAFGLVMLGALGLMAVFAGIAQAGEAGTYFQKNTKGESVPFTLAPLTGELEFSSVAVLLVPGRNLTLSCLFASVISGSLETTTQAEAEVKFFACEPRNHKSGAALPCKVGVSIVAKAKFRPFLHEKTKKYVTAEPKEAGGNFTVIELTGAECTLPVKNPVTGTVSAEVTTNDAVVDLVSASEAFSKLVGDTLKFGGFSAFLGGNGVVELIAGFSGFKFGVV